MTTMIKKLLLAAAAISTAGCAAQFNGHEQALTVAEEHPISVDSQTVTMTLAENRGKLSELDNARLKAFAQSYLNNGHGVLTVTAPDNADATAVRDALNQSGVSPASVVDAEYRGGGQRDIILSYIHYVATPSACGIWEGLRERDYRNMRSPNFGCAAQNNLAAMIGDPHDLIAPADMTPPDSATRIQSVAKYRAGQDTSSQTNSEVSAQVSDK